MRRMPSLLTAPLCLALALIAASPAAAAEVEAPPAAWAAASRPSSGAPRVVGGHGLGCIGGAQALPAEGPGWQAVRLSRNRFWGHPALLHFIRDLSARARASGLPDLWIGDLGQPRGGPLPWGHASHQIGLDADIWFDLSPKPRLPPSARESIEVASLVRPDGLDIDPARFTPAHARLIRLAAEGAGVDRIFVNAAIKQALCRDYAGEAWLRRVRPWRGHDSHFHVRLSCPAGQAECHDQAPVPAGDGCDTSLNWWFTAEALHPPRSSRPAAPPPRRPAACAGILAAP
jgi:penicillin-insensitive murein endopeptidase